ncbi:HNH endonuclease signature motif containing protein [Sphaerisporangium sp. NPDC049003]|uniref:HNH endonuclease signature motif containing protein n=1 Tax=Sphaerisporangium sp. NPDC049003 TaxID=3364517 RepID=UPI00371DE2B3
MPTRAPRRCTAAGCGEDSEFDGRCARHRHPTRRGKAQPRPSSHAQGYDRAWRVISERARAEEPWCATGCGAPSEHVDHIDGDKTNNVRSNLQALCRPCHSRKTVLHDGGFGNERTPRW